MISENLKILRGLQDYTRDDLAEILNQPSEIIGEWERGECRPGDAAIRVLEDLFGVPAGTLAKKMSVKALHACSVEHIPIGEPVGFYDGSFRLKPGHYHIVGLSPLKVRGWVRRNRCQHFIECAETLTILKHLAGVTIPLGIPLPVKDRETVLLCRPREPGPVEGFGHMEFLLIRYSPAGVGEPNGRAR